MSHHKEFRIGGDQRMADVIELNHRFLLVIERFGIPLGFGDKSVFEICVKYKLDPALVLIVLNVFNDHEFSVSGLLSEDMVPGIVNYLKQGHCYYLQNKLPYISELIDRFISNTENPDTRLLQSFFKEYVNEVTEHMNLEENTVFPYVISQYERIGEREKAEKDTFGYRIDKFVDNHSNIEEKLDDLKQLLIKHFPPSNGRFYRNQILLELFDLEYDLNDHNGLEEKVLAPLVRKIEKRG